jgi:pimeloyl-ACP methyl ester carboxylesterase
MDNAAQSEPTVKLPYATGFATSKDGTTIGYRQLGHGPGLLLVPGGMMAAQNFMKLATALASDYTVYVLDRRGRGLSGPCSDGFGIQQAVEDTQTVIAKTGAHYVFGLSAGAVVSLWTARVTPAIRRVAAYEPPFSLSSIPESSPRPWLVRYDQEIAQGKLADAMVTVNKGIMGAPVFGMLPRFITASLMKLAIPADAKSVKDGDVPLRDIIPTIHFDSQIVLDTEDKLEALKSIPAHVLLLGGSRSPSYLRRILDAVAIALPHAQRVQLAGVGHMAADNGGRPQRVAEELRRFFTESRGAELESNSRREGRP